jgi:hypothetical protein
MSHPLSVRRVVAKYAPDLRAVLHEGRQLLYTVGLERRSGVPAHVRAASAIRRRGSRLIVVQDDVNALAVLDSAGGVVPLLLPSGTDGQRIFDDSRGNKHLKMDLEAGVVLPDGRLVAFGSGSSPEREQLVVVGPRSNVRVVPAAMLYAGLRRCTDAMGADLNIEGAVIQSDRLRLLQRGNGRRATACAAGSALLDLSLTAVLAWLQSGEETPAVMSMIGFDLGDADGVPYGFTDATVTDDGRLAFVACAEDSVDAQSDGPVRGCRFGWIDDSSVRLTEVIDLQGRPTTLKLEGIESRAGVGGRVFDVVADMDRPDEAAWMYELRVSG